MLLLDASVRGSYVILHPARQSPAVNALNVAIMSLIVEEHNDRLSIYRISSGSCAIEDYGLKLAKHSGLR